MFAECSNERKRSIYYEIKQSSVVTLSRQVECQLNETQKTTNSGRNIVT